MDIPKQRHYQRKKEAREFWLRVATDYNAGMTPKEIAERYTNPNTGKPYTREHIHWILKKLRETPAEEIEKYVED